METLMSNLRHALRRIFHNPVYSGTIVLCLLLGIGANAAIFSVINTLLLRPLPVEDADRLVFVLDMREWSDPFEASLVDYVTFRRDGKSFAGVGVAHRESFDLLGGDRPERLEAAAISADYLPTLGVEPIRGRGFTAEESRSEGSRVVLVGHGLWQRRFGGDPELVGRTLSLGGEGYTVVGILPPAFDLPLVTELWIPLGMEIESLPVDQQAASDYLMVARLRRGVSLDQANTEAESLARRIAESYPEQREGWGIKLIPLRQQLLGDINGKIRPALLLVVAVVGFLLLIACGNVASLLLVRSLERGHEVAVQTALGASRGRLVGQLLSESVLLALAGGAAGLLVAYWVTPALMALSPVRAVSLKDIFAAPQIDVRVLGFTFLISLATGVLFGLAPALRTSLPGSLVTYLKEGGGRASANRGGRRLLAALVVAEITVAVMLLLGAGLAVRSFRGIQETALGFQPDGKLAVELYLSEERYGEGYQRAGYVERLLEEVRSLPGVLAAGSTTNIPLAISSWDAPYVVEGTVPTQSSEVPITAHRLVSPGYLEMMGISLLQGRTLTEQDRDGAVPVVVVSRELARRAWPGESALGKRLQLGVAPREGAPTFTVVGVVEDVKEDRFNFGIDRPVWYLPYAQFPRNLPVSLVLQAEGDPLQLADAVRQAIWSVDGDQPIAEILTLESHLAQFLGPQRFTALLMGVFALLGLLLAAVGLYGTLSYSVAQETREMGIRMALGARSGDLLRLSLGRGLRLAVLGLALGLAGGWALARLLSGTIEQLHGAGPLTLVTISAVLLVVALAAVYLPARRTSRIDPTAALRYE